MAITPVDPGGAGLSCSISGTLGTNTGTLVSNSVVIYNEQSTHIVDARIIINYTVDKNSGNFNTDIEIQMRGRNTAVTLGNWQLTPGGVTSSGFYNTAAASFPLGSTFSASKITLNNWTTVIKYSGSKISSPSSQTSASFKIGSTMFKWYLNSVSSVSYVSFNINLTVPKTTCTWKFDGNGGTISGTSVFTKTIGTTITTPSATRNNGRGSGSYTVTFKRNNGKSDVSIDCPYTTTITYNFKNYKSGSDTIGAGESGTMKSDKDWSASWSSNESPGSSTLKSIPANPTKFGYIFSTWNPKVSSGQVVTSDFTVNAEYIPQTYKVTYDLNRSKISSISNPIYVFKTPIINSDEGIKTFGTNVNFTKNIPVAFGYNFIGWGTKDKCIYNYSNGSFDKSFDDQIVISDDKIPTTLTLYAHWEPIKDTVITNYYMINGTAYQIKSETNFYGLKSESDPKEITHFIVPNPTRRKVSGTDDWVFLGWYVPKEWPTNKPFVNKPLSASGKEFWGNTSVATEMGDQLFAYGTFRNPDDINEKTLGKAESLVSINMNQGSKTDKSSWVDKWKSLSGQEDNTEYDKINKSAWNWIWEFYGFWTITGKYVCTDIDETTGERTWNKVSAAYVMVLNSDGDKVWKYIPEVKVCIGKSGSNPIWRPEIRQ